MRSGKPRFPLKALAFGVALASLSASGQEKTAVGVTLAARGEVAATDLVALEERALRRRSDVFNVDRVTTGEGARAQIRMEDDALLSLRADSELVIAEYEYNEETGEGRAIMELVAGGLRTLSGGISPDAAGSDYELRTSAGSIGIRGTHYEVVIQGPDTVMGVWEGNIDVDPPTGERFSLGQDGDFSFAAINEEGEVEFLLDPPEVFSEGYDDEGAEEEESEDQSDASEEDTDEASEEEENESEDSDESEDEESDDEEEQDGTEEQPEDEGSADGDADDEAGDSDESDTNTELADSNEEETSGSDLGAGDPTDGAEEPGGDEPPTNPEPTLPSDDDDGISQNLLTALEPTPEPRPQSSQTGGNTTEPGDLQDRIEEAEESAEDQDQDQDQDQEQPSTQPVSLVPSAPTAVASREGTVTYSDPEFELADGAAGYSMTLRFTVNFNSGTVDDGYLALESDNDTWQGWFTGGIGTVNADGHIGLQLGDTLSENPMSIAVHNNNPAEGYMNGIFYGESAQQVRGDFDMTDLVTEKSISGDYRVNEQ